jgi:ribosome modulation factor
MKTAKSYFDMGYEARNQGLSKEANPLLFGKGWPHEAWNLGFEFAELELAAPMQSEAILERVPANPFKQGQNAHIRGIDFDDCPYGEGRDRFNWQAGWISQHDNESDPLAPARGCFNALTWMLAAALILAIVWALTFGGVWQNYVVCTKLSGQAYVECVAKDVFF